MNIAKAETLIVRDKDGVVICTIKIGMISLAKMNDKSQVLTIQQANQ